MTTYVYKSTTGRPVNVEDYVVTVNPGLQSTEQIEALDAYIGSSISRYDDGVLATTDNIFNVTATKSSSGGMSLSANGTEYKERNLTSYFSIAEVTAMRTNVYTGINITSICDKLEAALYLHASSGWRLTVDGKLTIKVNRPIRFSGGLYFAAEAPSAGQLGLIIYPDLSVDWSVSFPDRGVLETANFDYPTLAPGTSAWPNAKPDFNQMCTLQNIAIRCEYDSALFVSNPERIPDYGFVVHCANEAWSARSCYAYFAKKNGWLFSGLQSTPTLYNCGSMLTGRKSGNVSQDTIFGAAVTRISGGTGAFAAAVYVYNTVYTASTGLVLEAAGGTDLGNISSGDVLAINGTNYTVSGAPSVASRIINQSTRISGVTTTTRYIVNIVLSANIPAFTRGRVFHTGLGFRLHPNSSFAPGVTSSNGGQGYAGMVNTYNFSGDVNTDGLFSIEEAGTLNMISAKSEFNGSLVLILSNNGNGGAKPKAIASGGFRVDGDGATNMVDQAVCRIVGTQGRASFYATGGFINASGYANTVLDLSNSGRPVVASAAAGGGIVSYCGDSTEPSYISVLGTTRVKVIDNGASIETQALSAANYRFRLQTNYSGTNTHRFQMGAAGSELDFIVIDGGTSPTAIKYKTYNGSTMVDMITFNGTGGMGFYAATPIAKPTISGAKGSNVALGSLLTQLAALGLITDSTTA